MKFTTTYNVTNRYPIGEIPKPWIDYGKDHMDSVHEYFYREIKLYDWDICGEETHDFLFEDGKAFRLEYSWWSEWYHDDYAYAKDEAEMIIKRIDSNSEIYGLECHDKYTFFDTEWERKEVLADHQGSVWDREITIYLNT